MCASHTASLGNWWHYKDEEAGVFKCEASWPIIHHSGSGDEAESWYADMFFKNCRLEHIIQKIFKGINK